MLPALLQRIVFDAHKICGIVANSWVGTFSLGKGGLCHALSPHQPRGSVVSLDATRLVINSVLIVALPGELLFDGPGPSPHGWIFDGDDVFESVRPGASPALQ